MLLSAATTVSRLSSRLLWTCCLFLVFSTFPQLADAEDSTAETESASVEEHAKLQFFENRIRPLLIEQCFDCHNEDVQESGLRLDSLQAMIDGGERGPAIVPGDAAGSLLMHAVNHSEAELQMPEGDKLLARQIKDLATWINDGALWPNQIALSRKKARREGPLFSQDEQSFWAFVKPTLPELPQVADQQWPQAEVDYFVLAHLEDNGLVPAPPATRRTLIRRAYFDLIGLPPTAGQVDAFESDNSPGAFERVVDSLLATPQYGERWGRHWLDVARYADSNGLDENWAFEFIYKYRDWVVDAFNRDLPFDQFVTHQIAGDLIKQKPTETQDDYVYRLSAAGFLSLGPKMIADDDPKKKKMDIIDEQLGTVSQTFMALTVGCARCHDHKFDPIPTWDYYAMASIFKSTKTMEHLRVVAPVSLHVFKPEGYDDAFAVYNAQHEKLVRDRDDFWIRVAMDRWKTQKKKNKKAAAKQNGKSADDFQLPAKAGSFVPDQHRAEWVKLSNAVSQHLSTAPQKIKVMAPTDAEPEDLRVSLRGNYLTLGEQTHRQFLRIIDGEQAAPVKTAQSGRLELAKWLTSREHPLTARVLVNRFWRWRFGRGIVATTDNFGKLGQRPTHPALLDWLACKFMEDGWSMKRLHKRMMLSATYQMSSQFEAKAADQDPQNVHLWRFPRKRLEAEAIRDSLLGVSDFLDLKIGGSLMPLKDREYVTGTASKTQKYDNPRRSIYQPIYRSAVYDVLTSFDFPDPATPNGDRKPSTVAPQALVMMNSPLVTSAAKRIGDELLTQYATDQVRIKQLYRRVLSRSPTDSERAAIGRYLDREYQAVKQTEASSEDLHSTPTASQRIWWGLSRVLLSSNEFLYVD